MGLGTEILFILMLGLLVLGPKQLHTIFRVCSEMPDRARTHWSIRPRSKSRSSISDSSVRKSKL